MIIDDARAPTEPLGTAPEPPAGQSAGAIRRSKRSDKPLTSPSNSTRARIRELHVLATTELARIYRDERLKRPSTLNILSPASEQKNLTRIANKVASSLTFRKTVARKPSAWNMSLRIAALERKAVNAGELVVTPDRAAAITLEGLAGEQMNIPLLIAWSPWLTRKLDHRGETKGASLGPETQKVLCSVERGGKEGITCACK